MMTMRPLATILVASVLVSGCGGVTLKELLGFPADPTPTQPGRSAARPWALIKNPAFGSRPSEPEYIWVEEDKIPTTVGTILSFSGKQSLVASPEIVAKYGSPPGGGKVSSLHGGPFASNSSSAVAKQTVKGEPKSAPPVLPAPPPTRGYVVYVDTTRVVIDLTAQDGLKPGSMVSLRRPKIPIIHPVTGEFLGELEEEVATARVIEIRERFSVAEIQGSAPGTQIRVKDLVFLP